VPDDSERADVENDRRGRLRPHPRRAHADRRGPRLGSGPPRRRRPWCHRPSVSSPWSSNGPSHPTRPARPAPRRGDGRAPPRAARPADPVRRLHRAGRPRAHGRRCGRFRRCLPRRGPGGCRRLRSARGHRPRARAPRGLHAHARRPRPHDRRPVRPVARRDVGPLRRPRRSRARLGPGDRDRAALRTRRRARRRSGVLRPPGHRPAARRHHVRRRGHACSGCDADRTARRVHRSSPAGRSRIVSVTVQEQSAKLLGPLSGTATVWALELGLRLGIFDELARRTGGASSGELATALGLDPQYTHLVLRAAFAAEILERDGDRYHFAEHMAGLLLDQDHPAFLGGALRVLVALRESFLDLRDFARSGQREWWSDFDPEWIEAVGTHCQAYYSRMLKMVVPEIPGLAERFAAGARYLDLACGTCRGPAKILAAHPATSVTAVDADEYTLEIAEREMKERGLGER